METTKKNYKKLQHTGNENGWHEPIVSLGVTAITKDQADELNSVFASTGTKYEETDEKPYDEAPLEVPVTIAQGYVKVMASTTAKVPKAKKPKVAKSAEHKGDN